MTGNDIFKANSSLAPGTMQVILKELRNTLFSEFSINVTKQNYLTFAGYHQMMVIWLYRSFQLLNILLTL